MTWVNPPQTIIDWRDALLATATIQTLLTGLTTLQQQARFHYPEATPTDFASLPCWVLGRAFQSYRLESAARSFGNGTVEAVGYFAASSDIGTVEAQINVAQELVELNGGNYLYVITADVSRSSVPSASQLATAEAGQARTSVPCFTILYTAEWEG